MMRARRLLAAVAVACAASVTAALPSARADAPARFGSSRAVVIVDTGGGAEQRVITFSGSVNGIQALQLAGTNPVTLNYGGSLGQAVCRLYGVGDEPAPGTCPGGWRYYRAAGGAGSWSFSGAGPSNTVVRDGDVEGWGYNRTPPFSSFCAVAGCAPPPPPPPPPAPGDRGGTGATSTGGGGSGGGVIPPVAIPPELATTTTSGTEGTTPSTEPAREDGDAARGERRVSARLTSDTDDGAGGPPASLLLLTGALAALGGGIVVARRARRARAGPPQE